MRGKKGNLRDRVKKLQESEAERGRVFADLCRHVEMGFSMDCYTEVTLEVIERMFRDYPEQFDSEEFKLSLQKGKQMWEGIGKAQANGQCLGNSRSWFYNMAHRYKWSDRVDIQADVKGQVSVDVISYATLKASKDDKDNKTR